VSFTVHYACFYRFGGPGGAFYPAVVLRVRWLDDDGDAASVGDTDAAPHFDLKYDQDGHQVSYILVVQAVAVVQSSALVVVRLVS
jgi:hypothetical protein